MSEITRMLTQELEARREEDRRREELLTELLTRQAMHLSDLSAQLGEQRQRDEDAMRKLQGLTASLAEFQARLEEFEMRLSELAES